MASYHKDLLEVATAHGTNPADVKNDNKKDTELHMYMNSMASIQSQRLTKSCYMAKTLPLLFVKYRGH